MIRIVLNFGKIAFGKAVIFTVYILLTCEQGGLPFFQEILWFPFLVFTFHYVGGSPLIPDLLLCVVFLKQFVNEIAYLIFLTYL